jgi:uncharacterized protein (DUF924 family)
VKLQISFWQITSIDEWKAKNLKIDFAVENRLARWRKNVNNARHFQMFNKKPSEIISATRGFPDAMKRDREKRENPEIEFVIANRKTQTRKQFCENCAMDL